MNPDAGQREPRPPFSSSDLDAPHLTDMGNGERFARDHRENVRYCHPWKKWLVWDTCRWKPDNAGDIMAKAKITVKAIYADAHYSEAKDDRTKLAAHAAASEAERRLAAMLTLAASEPGIPVVPEQLDQDPWSFNVINGTIDLKTATLRPHRRDDYLTKLAPVLYDPDATCPTWLAFLDRIFAGNQRLIGFVQKAIGYGLTGDTSEQCFFVFWGAGSNGKSTLVMATMNAIGDYALQTPVETLLVKKYDGSIPNDVARLKGARFVAAAESGMGRALAEGLVKQMTGGEKLPARFLHAEWFEFAPAFKLFLATNHRPVIRGTDYAIWRRVRLVPFMVTIPESEQDCQLPDKLKLELPGILAWAVQGCLAWQREGLKPPQEVQDATAEYRSDMDVVGDFLAERFVKDRLGSVTAASMAEAYLSWCRDANEKPMTKTALGLALSERGYDKARIRHVWTWLGLRLRAPGEDSEE